MKYYRILEIAKIPDRWGLEDINVDDDEIFAVGQPVEVSNFKKLQVETHLDGVALDYSETISRGVPIVSEKFADILYEYGQDIQLLPIKVVGYTGRYYVLVVTNGLDCIDERRSEYEKYRKGNKIRPDLAGEYKIINVLKIDPKKVDRSIFRLKKYTLPVIVSEEVKTKLENSSLTGFQFKLVS